MKPIVVAVGGNALVKDGEEGTIYQQFANARETCDHIVKLIGMGYSLVLTHGNGPQVGNTLLRHEGSREKIPPYPLGVCVAETIGSMGYMFQQTMQNTLRHENIEKTAVTVITQVVVDKDDPAFENPTKPIGQFFTKEEIQPMIDNEGWQVVEDSGRGWRRVVASPMPESIMEEQQIKQLLNAGTVVIACGGGGLPVIFDEQDDLDGREAVIDKDYASAELALELGCEKFVILTGVEKVYLDYGKETQRAMDRMTVEEAEKYMEEGQFPAGSMGPKIKAALKFLEHGGKEVIITDIHLCEKAVAGEAGTHIVAG